MPKSPVKTHKSAVTLYQSDKYKVQVGRGTAGFCTAWNEPQAVVAKAPALLNRSAIVGTLYSRYGVNVILRNLALNPSIRRLYLWGNGPLSNTKFGVMGASLLKQLWFHGCNAEGKIEGTDFKLEKEIEYEVLKKVLQNVELIDLSRDALASAVAKVDGEPGEPYMAPQSFPESPLVETDTFPSEKIGWLVRGRGIVDTWTHVVERIMRYGTVKGTQYGSQQKELIGVTWVVSDEDPTHPIFPADWPKELREVTGATSAAIAEYHAVFLSPKKPRGVSYTYGNRLMRYPSHTLSTLDQIKTSIIRNLKDSPDSRRAVATTLVPWIDAKSSEPPCITQVQFLQSGGKLNLLVTVRSHDIFKAAIPNAFGLRILQQEVTQTTGFEMGAMQITSQSAHLYESDWDNAKKLVRCAIWERPAKPWTRGEDSDPRGIFLIRASNGKIIAEFQADGQTLLRFEASDADTIAREIAKHELTSQTYHAMDIGIQLARAEVAMKKGIEYTQDKPLY